MHPFESPSETYMFTEKFAYYFRSILDVLKLIGKFTSKFKFRILDILILFEISAY